MSLKNLFAVAITAFTLLYGVQNTSADIINDSFDDGVIGTNTGDGSGFNMFTSAGASVTEGTGVVLVGGTAGNAMAHIGSIDTFNANAATAVTGVFSVSDFGRDESFDGFTTRAFVGFAESAATGGDGVGGAPLQNAGTDGLWIALQSREDENGADNGEGALFYNNNGVSTALATWTWDQSLVDFDTDPDLRSDRISTDLLDPLTLELTSDATGFSLNFSTSGAGILPSNISGTFAELGLVNDLNVVHASAFLQSDGLGSLALSSISVSTATAVPEPSSLMLLGCVAIGIGYRRRRNQA